MTQSIVEHINFTVSDPEVIAEQLCQIFDWKIRWSGDALDDGRTIHVGGEETYLALYDHPNQTLLPDRDHKFVANLNHVGMVVDDLDGVEAKVKSLDLVPYSYRDYEPGKRFYFLIGDDIEIEVVSYD